VEFIDVDEECSEDVRLVAELWKAEPRHTHADLHPALLQGTLAGLVPHSKNNHGVKVTNMCSHFKAVMHRYSLQHARRFDTQSSGHVPKSCVTYMGYHNQQPLVRPPGYDWHEMGHRPHGYNLVIAVCTAGGANQEDAVVIKRSLRDRGFGFGMCERTYFTECHQSDTVVIHKAVGSTFGPNDLLMQTSSSPRPPTRRAARGAQPLETARNTTVRAGLQESGVVTEVRRVDYDSQTAANKKVKYLISTHEACIPHLGDKFASPHAQKGVIGKIVDDMDMPFTRGGMRADVLLNPQSIPSRMTVGQLIEMIHGSHAAATGRHRREFTYDETPVEQVMQELAAASGMDGMQEAGLQVMHDPYTGAAYDAKVFTGVCYYSRLKHLVSEKVRANDIVGGEINPITRQGGSGRKHNGGIKAAEMERWSIIGNGAVHTVRELYRKLSDGAELHVQRVAPTGDEPAARGGLRSDPLNVAPNSDRIESNYSTAACIHRLNAAMIDLDITTQTRSIETELPEM
jgi:DNA-directed RNA polymerase beta subunit